MNPSARHRIDSAQQAVQRARRALYQMRVRLLRAEKAGSPLANQDIALETIDQDLAIACEDMSKAIVVDDAKGTAA